MTTIPDQWPGLTASNPGGNWKYLSAFARTLAVIIPVFLMGRHLVVAGEVLPEFTYRQVTLNVAQADGAPVPGASIYGFCPGLNLVWPRKAHRVEGQDDVLWEESFLGKTDANGSVKAIVPSGNWGFFAAGQGAPSPGLVIAAWTDFRMRENGEEIRLVPTLSKHWALCLADTNPVEPGRIFLKPEGYPIWIPVNANGLRQTDITDGHFQIWATGNADTNHSGFALAWGRLSGLTPDGNVFPPEKPAVVECDGGDGQASLSWLRRQSFGLEGDIALCNHAKVLMTPGLFALGYCRPITAGITGKFVAQSYDLAASGTISLNMVTPLDPALDEALTKSEDRLVGQLYLVDGNGHILSGLFDAANNPVMLHAAVILNGQRYDARPVFHKVETALEDDTGDTMTDKSGQLKFIADVGATAADGGAVWEFQGPTGVLPQSRVAPGPRVNITSRTFTMNVPQALQRPAQNLIAQADILAEVMGNASERVRRVQPTLITIDPGKIGAVSAHDGSHITMGCALLFDEVPVTEHTFVHELGHNFAFTHGGLHETTVEVSRCAGGEQISGQQSKWMFMDRMNGLTRPETPFKYPNVGLYLYCYSQGGPNFLRFMSLNEYEIIHKLRKQYTKDEVTTALLSLALGRDMTGICSNYGLNVTADRVSQVMTAVRPLCRIP